MILIILFALLLIVGIIGIKVFWDRIDYVEGLPIASAFATGIGGIGLICCGFLCFISNSEASHIGASIKYSETAASLNLTYKVLTQAEDSYAKYTAIQQYNTEVKNFKQDIVTTQAHLKNPWINWMCNYEYKNFDANIVSYIEVE